jgi:mRNA interferase HigB
MRIIARKTLKRFGERQPSAELPLRAWFTEAKHASWDNPLAIKEQYPHASILRQGRVVFNFGGNKFRLVAQINYSSRIAYIRFIGTHQEYDRIDAQVI